MTAPIQPLSVPDADDYEPPLPGRHTDVGNARRLVHRDGHQLRYVPAWDQWLCWDGRRWRRDTIGQVVEHAKSVAADLWREVASAKTTEERRAAVKWATESENAGRIRAMIALARSEPGIPVEPHQLDADPWLLNVANGTLDLRTGNLRGHDPKDLITKITAAGHQPDAAASLWDAVLERALPDPDVRTFVQRAAGYSITGSTREQVLIFCVGTGGNAKSTIVEALLGALGDYARQAEPELLLARDSAHPTGIADLQGARLVVASEIDDGRRLAEATVKRLTGDKTLKARLMRMDFFEFPATHTLWLHANHRPIVRGTDHAIWRRIRLVPFTVTIPADERDPNLADKLARELDGILAWAVRGCLDWQSGGLTNPDAVQAAADDYRADMDVLGTFLADKCIAIPGAVASAGDLYQAYVSWADANGERAVSQRRLGSTLTERGFDRRRNSLSGRYEWHGIGLLAGDPERSEPSEPDSSNTPHAHAHARRTPDQVRKVRIVQPGGRLPYKDALE